jgi:hypothetical protein
MPRDLLSHEIPHDRHAARDDEHTHAPSAVAVPVIHASRSGDVGFVVMLLRR